MLVEVKYGRVTDWDAVLRCRRCRGTGREIHVPGECPRCEGTGRRADGWAYEIDEPVRVGSIVLAPPTPRTNGEPIEATVVAVGSDMPDVRKRIIRVIEL